jgi:uncharacterized protein
MASTVLHPTQALTDPKSYWKLILLSSFLLTSMMILGPEYIRDPRSESDATIPMVSPVGYILAGLLVGFGTRLGNGCTSGHGVCGMARFSKRSWTAVMTFMATAMMTVYLTSPTAPWAKTTEFLRTDQPSPVNEQLAYRVVSSVIAVAMLAPLFFKGKKDPSKFGAAAAAGALFAAGLGISQMTVGAKLFSFLNVKSIADGSWDPTLMTVLGSAVGVSFLSYQFTLKHRVINFPYKLHKPIAVHEYSVPTNTKIDNNLLIGSAVFGIGWALASVCPGPALFLAANGHEHIIHEWFPAFFLGSYLGEILKS